MNGENRGEQSMINVFPQIFVLGILIGYLALLVGFVWWAWRPRIRSGRRLLSFLGVLRENGVVLRKHCSENANRAASQSRSTGGDQQHGPMPMPAADDARTHEIYPGKTKIETHP